MDIKHPTAGTSKPAGSTEQVLPPGSRIGRYEVLDMLGGGGMGMVYRALDPRLQREVAIKVLHEKESFAGMRERLLREARAVSSINHPSICTLYDIGEQNGDPYLVMELLHGETLRDRIRRQPLTPVELVDYSMQIADALTEAHSKAIVHRDIKPANIFLTNKVTGSVQVKVLDFGLAKRHIDGMAHDTLDLTGPGNTIGTIAYMSPEQARGEPLDARTDLFSFGTVMYEMATNNVPFSGQTSALVFVELLERDPKPVREWNRKIPPKLAAIITKALKKDYAERYQTAAEIHNDLEGVWADIWSPPTTTLSVAAVAEADPQAAPKATPLESTARKSSEVKATAPVERELPSQDISGSPPILPPPIVPLATRPTAPGYELPAAPPIPPSRLRVDDPNVKSDWPIRSGSSPSQKVATKKKKNNKTSRAIGLTMVVLGLILATAIYIQFGRATAATGLQQGDSILIGRIDNKTESSSLDHSFRVGLALELAQSPYVNAVLGADDQSSMSGSRGTMTGSISGTEPFVVDLRLMAPNSTKPLAEVQDTAQDLDHVLETIDRVSLEFRRQFGESTNSRDSFFRPLHQETTASLDALENFSVGETIMASHGDPSLAIAAYVKALDGDKGDKYFSLASERLALLYEAANYPLTAAQYADSAYSGRQTLSERSELEIEVIHAWLVDKNQAEVQNWLKQLHTEYPTDTTLDKVVSTPVPNSATPVAPPPPVSPTQPLTTNTPDQ
jgi:serine/threonine-protein kinase